ncbi:MAG: transglutaminase family protein [Acidobacteriota bacterium]|nr:MAG: transglutaminase family protein [Acidobacteriota bacterium]
MKFLIRHRIEYTYTDLVTLEPIIVRLRPLCNAFQEVLRHQIQVSPEPGGNWPLIDYAGNPAQRFWFNGQHRRLRLEAFSEVETRRDNPFDFLLLPGCEKIPFEYEESTWRLLESYVKGRSIPEVTALAQGVLKDSGGETVPFLMRLASVLHEEIGLRRRPRGDPRSPERTLRLKQGACRDLAVLYAAACRSVGLASRFVSGYWHGPQIKTPELHAWCEVYLPGAGWRGFDPAAGLAVDSTYIALAAGLTHHEARPTEGTFRGPARSRMRTTVRVEAL